MTIDELIRRAHVSRATLIGGVGVTARTLRDYASTNAAPRCVRSLLEIYAGHMPWLGFERMRVNRGVIYYRDNPDGVPATEIPGYAFRLRHLEVMCRDLERYRRAPVQYLLDID